MKTKIRTIIGMAALGIIGFTNINATTDNKNEVNTNVVSEKEESLTIESWMLENGNWTEKTETDTAEVEKPLEVETWMIDEDFFKLVESVTAAETDLEIEKFAQKQITLSKIRNEK